ncbi:hypothetical protein BTL50_16875 [Bordetella holmesii]|nr:hypothetical protein H558_04895 [Bordetella holmesii H558]AOB36989.1 hypothetical protein BBB42_16690 [Bordetella holmesii]EWM50487.1 hypothetical protein D557_0330 [Bordetella holmesii 70147]AUL20938.1 hypothetical protein BTL46_16785 [Bordetella holmesii]AUL27603.1 hypothetical protein BTL49_16880 [Bordetella holmesii]
MSQRAGASSPPCWVIGRSGALNGEENGRVSHAASERNSACFRHLVFKKTSVVCLNGGVLAIHIA